MNYKESCRVSDAGGSGVTIQLSFAEKVLMARCLVAGHKAGIFKNGDDGEIYDDLLNLKLGMNPESSVYDPKLEEVIGKEEGWWKEPKKPEEYDLEVVRYNDYKPQRTMMLHGTLEDMFNELSDMNERYTYINGTWFEFKDAKADEAYRAWSKSKGWAYFARRAANNGATID